MSQEATEEMTLDLDLTFEPSPDDWVTEDHRTFYQYDRPVLRLAGDETLPEMWKAIDKAMTRAKHYPNVWFLSDHGNMHLMEK